MPGNIEKKKALDIIPGVGQALSLNEGAIKTIKNKAKKIRPVREYIEGILKGNKIILSQAITLIESTLPAHQEIAGQIIDEGIKKSGNSIRIAVTGPPGAGKSSLIETLGLELINAGKKLAVLAIDPTSEISRGSILGDKTRMENLSVKSGAFIRPTPTSGTLGGVAKKTRETIILCEAAGFDTIFIETVGVGQNETTVKSMVDFFMLMVLPGSGDELQGIKRGIMEMADLIVISKADGDNIKKADLAKTAFQHATDIMPPPVSGYKPRVLLSSALYAVGIKEILANINDYIQFTKGNGYFLQNRSKQARYWMLESISENLKSQFFDHPEIKTRLKEIEKDVLDNKINPFKAASILINTYFNYFMK